MMNNWGTSMWDLLQEMTSKQSWYSKVFDDRIVEKWRLEAKNDRHFDAAIRLLRATAQGSELKRDCPWSYPTMACDKCIKELEDRIRANPAVYTFEDVDLDDPDFDMNEYANDYAYSIKLTCDHPDCDCVAPHHHLADYVQYYPRGLISPQLHNKCKDIITLMMKQEPVDWHPGSDSKVRDLIHPSLYCYVKGISRHNDGSVGEPTLEPERYSWLPSEFTLNPVKITSYINNLDSAKYPQFIPMIEELFTQFVPSLNKIC